MVPVCNFPKYIKAFAFTSALLNLAPAGFTILWVFLGRHSFSELVRDLLWLGLLALPFTLASGAAFISCQAKAKRWPMIRGFLSFSQLLHIVVLGLSAFMLTLRNHPHIAPMAGFILLPISLLLLNAFHLFTFSLLKHHLPEGV